MIDWKILRDSLSELASQDLQERYWLHGAEFNEISSFEEAICGVFDDSGLSRAIDTGWVAKNVAVEVRSVIAELDKAVGLVPQGQAPEVVISHPAMDEVREVAGRLLGLFRDG